MAYGYEKTEGGNAKGHSNMAHWDHTEYIKRVTKKKRRQQGKNEIRKELMYFMG